MSDDTLQYTPAGVASSAATEVPNAFLSSTELWGDAAPTTQPKAAVVPCTARATRRYRHD
jgi:hypothetical protein